MAPYANPLIDERGTMMHRSAREFLDEHKASVLCLEQKAVDFGGRYVNGDVHDLWPDHEWTIIDNHPDPVVVYNGHPSLIQCQYVRENAARWVPDIKADLVICTEVFEHTKEWPSICDVAYKTLTFGGVFLITTAGYGRKKHSMYDGGPLRDGEYYENISVHSLGMVLSSIGFHSRLTYNPHDKDVYVIAVKQA